MQAVSTRGYSVMLGYWRIRTDSEGERSRWLDAQGDIGHDARATATLSTHQDTIFGGENNTPAKSKSSLRDPKMPACK